MTILEANRICTDFEGLGNPSGEERFLYIEALEYLIRETGDADRMVQLGAYYYGEKQFDLALKYYEMAAEEGNLYAISNLGYIWYYGRTGQRDYQKAFYYFDKARKMGDPVAAYKVADMYKNGYYVEKDPGRYKEIIEELYPVVKQAQYLEDPLPEVYTRLARIRTEEGRISEALQLYDVARDFLAQRIRINPFFGNLNIMKWTIEDMCKLRQLDLAWFSLYDLYELLKRPVRVGFTWQEEKHEVEAVREDGGLVIRFDDKWYRTVDDFFLKAEIDGEHLTALYEELYDFEVLAWN